MGKRIDREVACDMIHSNPDNCATLVNDDSCQICRNVSCGESSSTSEIAANTTTENSRVVNDSTMHGNQVDIGGDGLALSNTTNAADVVVQGINAESQNSPCSSSVAHEGDNSIQQFNLNNVGSTATDHTIADVKVANGIGERQMSNQTIHPVYSSMVNADASVSVVHAKSAIRAMRNTSVTPGSSSTQSSTAHAKASSLLPASVDAISSSHVPSNIETVSDIERQAIAGSHLGQLSQLDDPSTIETLLARRIAQRESFFSRAIHAGGVAGEGSIDYQPNGGDQEAPTIMTAELVTGNSDPLIEERDRVAREARSILAAEAVRAEPIATTRDGKRSRNVFVGGVAIMIAIAVVALVVGIKLTSSESNANQAKEKSLPTFAPTRMTTPTSAPAVYGSNGYRVFTTTSQLRTAVATYVENARTGDLSNNSDISMEYGYPIGTWNVSRVTDFSRVFDPEPEQRLDLNRNPRFTSDFDEDLSGWDVSNALSMYGMFAAATSFTGMGVEHWNVSKVIDFSYMFAKAYMFHGNISLWETSNAKTMDSMFLEAQSFNGNLSSWTVDKVTSMSHMFDGASTFYGGDLRQWNVSKVANMEYMFYSSDFDGKVSTWDTSSVTNMNFMFSLSSINDDLSSWRVGNVRTMQGMFHQALQFEGGDLSRWDTSRTTDMSRIFNRAQTFHGDVSEWDVSNVVNLDNAFDWANSYDGDLSRWNTGRVKSMNSMFFRAELFSGGNLSSWDTSNVESITRMFSNAYAFSSDISSWNVSRLKDASFMFLNATSYNHSLCPWGIRLSGTVNLTQMFAGSACVIDSDPSMMDYTLGPYCAKCDGSK